jgi:multicomponent Na+:H+ antiporter subunit D
VGLPPMGGLWSKWALGVGALQSPHGWVLGVLMVSSLLSAAYLLPVAVRAFFAPLPDAGDGPVRVQEAPLPCLIALVATAVLSILLFFSAEPLAALLRLMPGAG